MDLTLKELKAKRASLKGALTRLENQITATGMESMDVIQVKVRRETLVEKMHVFDDVQMRIELLEEVEDTVERDSFEKHYYKILEMLDRRLEIDRASTLSPAPANSQHIASTSRGPSTQIRLPKIELPHFSGAYDEWYPFFDTFKCLIHQNESLNEIQRFHYLKSALSGEAAQVIECLEISTANYVQAWQMLEKRYDNRRMIVQGHIDALHELPVLQKENQTLLRQLLDGSLKHTRALKALNRSVDTWDDWLVNLIARKLDPITRKEWETKLTTQDMPTFEQLTDFLTHRCQILEAMSNKGSGLTVHSNEKRVLRSKTASLVSNKTIICPLCKSDHALYQCGSFQKMPVEQRIKEARARKICINCLRSGSHQAATCTAGNCRKCDKKHNTLLHRPREQATVQQTTTSDDKPDACQSNHVSANLSNYVRSRNISQTFLSTAIVELYDITNKPVRARILLDPGSQSNFVTEDMAKRLNLKRRKVDISITGINQATTRANDVVTIKFKSRFNAFTRDIECFVIPSITHDLPMASIPKEIFNIPKNLRLADPAFNVSSRIDLLIGVEIFWDLICVGQIRATNDHPYIQKTHLGWIIAGRLYNQNTRARKTTCNLSTNREIDTMLTKFWELESCTHQSNKFVKTKAEKECEMHFQETVKRNIEGRFIVNLPCKDKLSELGDTYEIALKRFHALERKLRQNATLKTEYTKFIHEYLHLNHMSRVTNKDFDHADKTYYMPHHAVIKESSSTTKLRVVFDASCKSSSGISLNDVLKVGPTIQQDLFSIIVRFRTFKYAITADIAKMYRQVLVDDSQTSLQRILWRDNEAQNIEIYELRTLTYGTAPASFLATRCLTEIATIEESNCPIGSLVIKRDFYVDDLITGADTISEAKIIRNQVTNILSKAGFELHKWASNSTELTNKQHNEEQKTLFITKQDDVRALGIRWNTKEDLLQYAIPTVSASQITKRKILSVIARVFDPLGLLGPVLVVAKIIVQRLWLLKIDWDESVPLSIHTEWVQYEGQLPRLDELRIPRQALSGEEISSIELHGFSDASEEAYGACIYIVCVDTNGIKASNLLCSRSRVAPLKNISLPRLELCGALLLAQLIHKVLPALPIAIKNIYCWSDSSIVLSWIGSAARNWVTFVANRVGEIQELLPDASWFHIDTLHNPADLVSRGVTPERLLNSELWWHGPKIILNNASSYKETLQFINKNETLEKRREPITCITVAQVNELRKFDEELFDRYSSLGKLIRVIAYCYRFMEGARKSAEYRNKAVLTVKEMHRSSSCLTRLVQRKCFPYEMKRLENKGSVVC